MINIPHEYGPSRVGHGEAQCIHCLATNRENAVIVPNHCEARAAKPNPMEPMYDTARLDWFEQQILKGRFEVAKSLYGTGFEFGWHGKTTTAEVHAGTLREAIDKQRSKE